jgi:hypothetical protein
MTSFLVEKFGGMDLKHDPRLIANNKAQIAYNCELERGSLHPLANDPNSGLGSVNASAISVFWYERQTWLSWGIDTDAVSAPIPDDKYNRAVVTQLAGSSPYPRLYSAGAYYRLGVPKPDSLPSVAVTQSPPIDDDTGEPDASIETESISYVYTFVDSFGAEGPPSRTSVSADRVIDTPVDLYLGASPPAGYNFGQSALKRVYRSSSGSGSAFYLFVGEWPISSQNVRDDINNADLQEALPSQTWVGPPDDDTSLYPDGPMVGVCVAANGIMAGFSHATICFSEPFMPHAWPFEYRITLDEPIVGMCAIAAGLLVVSEKRPYLVSGVHPASMALTAIDESQGLANKRGLVDMGSYAIYPSADGLVLVEGATARVATQDIITYEDFKRYAPATIEGYHEEGKYIGFYNGIASFIFDPRGGDNAFIDSDRYYRAGYHDGPTGKLLLNSSGTLVSWGDDPSLVTSSPYVWKSKKHVVGKALSFSVARVEAWHSFESYPVTMKIWADGELKDTLVFNSSEPPYLRMSAGYRGKVWEFELTGSNPITYVGLFEAMSELI